MKVSLFSETCVRNSTAETCLKGARHGPDSSRILPIPLPHRRWLRTRNTPKIPVKLVTLALGNNVSQLAKRRRSLVHSFRFPRSAQPMRYACERIIPSIPLRIIMIAIPAINSEKTFATARMPAFPSLRVIVCARENTRNTRAMLATSDTTVHPS